MKVFWDERYGNKDYAYGTAPNDFLVESTKYLQNTRKILSLGEGEGRNAVYLATLGHRVTALDQSTTGLKKATQLAASKNCTLSTVAADINDYDMGKDTYDCIISIFCHTPSATRKLLHQKIERALHHGGIFITEAYAPEQLQYKTGGPGDVDWLVALEELQTAFPSFVVLHEKTLQREVHEGKFHNGISVVTQYIGKKR